MPTFSLFALLQKNSHVNLWSSATLNVKLAMVAPMNLPSVDPDNSVMIRIEIMGTAQADMPLHNISAGRAFDKVC